MWAIHVWQIHVWEIHLWEIHLWEIHVWQIHVWQIRLWRSGLLRGVCSPQAGGEGAFGGNLPRFARKSPSGGFDFFFRMGYHRGQ